MRKFTLLWAAAAVGLAALGMALSAPITPTFAQAVQTPTPNPAVAVPSSTVDAFLIACADAAIVNFSGTLLSNFSVYYQLFASDGTAITGLRRADASGDFTYSERVPYPAGTALSTGGALTAQVRVARTTDASRIDFEFTLNDVQDGCGSPLYPLGSSSDSGSADSGGGGAVITGVGFTRSILAPDGVLNPNLQAEPDVFIGARPSEQFRSQTAGLIFAECNAFPLANPGLVYDTDRITVYWSWFAQTRELVDQHLANAQYSVRLNRATFNSVRISEPVFRDGDYWVFYTADAGNLLPGHYEVEYRVTWAAAISDGYDDFGPGTANFQLANNCNFNVLQNPNGVSVPHNLAFTPTEYPVHNLFND